MYLYIYEYIYTYYITDILGFRACTSSTSNGMMGTGGDRCGAGGAGGVVSKEDWWAGGTHFSYKFRMGYALTSDGTSDGLYTHFSWGSWWAIHSLLMRWGAGGERCGAGGAGGVVPEEDGWAGGHFEGSHHG